MLEELSTAVMLEDQAMTLPCSICKASLTAQCVVPIGTEQLAAGAELLQEALAQDNSAANGLTSAGLAALFAESWFPGLTPGYGAAGHSPTPLSRIALNSLEKP